MFFKKPKSDSPKDLYDWALELAEMMNRQPKDTKEDKKDVNKNAG